MLVTNYNPAFQKLGKTLGKHWKVIPKDKECNVIFPVPPIIGYKRHRNLNELLNLNRRHTNQHFKEHKEQI